MIRFRPNLNTITSRMVLAGLAILLVSTISRLVLLSKFLRDDMIETNSAQLQVLARYAAQDIDREVVERRELLKFIAAKVPVGYLLGPLKHAAQHADRMTRGEIPLEPLPVA